MRVYTPADLGRLLRERRQALGLTQAALAGRIGASRQWVVEVEAGKARAEMGLVLAALAALNLTLEVAVREPVAGIRTPPITGSTSRSAPPLGASLDAIDIDAIIDRARERPE